MTTAALPPAPARFVPVWLPWLAAPLFMLLPIGGCGLATRIYRPAATEVAVHPQAAPAGPHLVPLVPITRVVPVTADHRQVAWDRTTN
jgi:hypothetical protein